ncbi:MAG: N-acetyl-gamma-glutamyl-phosphate reductase [Planctomycetota bacterium]
MTRRVAVLGASGFTGKECLRLLAGHPDLEVACVMSLREEAGRTLRYAGALAEPEQRHWDPDALDGLDGALYCGPHEEAARQLPEVRDRVGTIVDLSAGFRFGDPELYPRVYGFEHPHPELLPERVYGLTEWVRAELPHAALIANPGCYVTSVLLPLLALRAAGVLREGADMIADCKSGVSGAGKKLDPSTHFASVHDDFRAYAVGAHRHEPEIREQLGSDRLFFTPHLLPVFRGILSTIHVAPAAGLGAADLCAALRERYAGEPFVEVLDEGLPCLAEVQGTNLCRIGVAAHGDRAVVVSCLDNLVKGASGQAIQNLNLALGLDETAGLVAPRPAPGGWR